MLHRNDMDGLLVVAYLGMHYVTSLNLPEMTVKDGHPANSTRLVKPNINIDDRKNVHIDDRRGRIDDEEYDFGMLTSEEISESLLHKEGTVCQKIFFSRVVKHEKFDPETYVSLTK